MHTHIRTHIQTCTHLHIPIIDNLPLPVTGLLLIFIKYGYTALHFAAEKGHRAAASQLLDKGIDIEAETRVRSTETRPNTV